MEIKFLKNCGVFKKDQVVDMERPRAQRYIEGKHAVEVDAVSPAVAPAPVVEPVQENEPEEIPEEWLAQDTEEEDEDDDLDF
jgi:hypothetical protein